MKITREAVEAFNRGGLDAMLAYADPQIEFREPPEQPAPRVALGVDEVAELWGEFESAWASHETEIAEIRAVDESRVLVETIEHFVGRDGLKVDAPFAGVATLDNGKVIRWEAFWDRERAFRAAGLPTDES